MHLHLRDGDVMRSVLPASTRVFRRAVIMPNLAPPITTIDQAKAYKKSILSEITKDINFLPLVTAYLTDDISSDELKKGFEEQVFFAAKLYPANATTNSSSGVRDIRNLYSVFEMMEQIGLPLLIHGEVTDSDVDIFDREAVFIEKYLQPLLKDFPLLKVVLEHITTQNAVQFVESSEYNLGATITPHHLHINRNAMFHGGFRSDFYCLPVAKREQHRVSLRRAATSGKSCFFLGTDSAPHLRDAKESACGCAGIFNAFNAIESYAQVFEEENALEKLEAFASEFGARFYGLPLNNDFITLEKRRCKVPDRIPLVGSFSEKEFIVPFHAGEYLNWSLVNTQT